MYMYDYLTCTCVFDASWYLLTRCRLYRVEADSYGSPSSAEPEDVIVSFDISWTAVTPYFDFDTDINHSAVARALATEPWSKTLFDKLEE